MISYKKHIINSRSQIMGFINIQSLYKIYIYEEVNLAHENNTDSTVISDSCINVEHLL